jgi:hypothetical protein
MRTDSASLLLDRQRIAALSAFPADSASLRFVAGRALSRDPADALPALR